MTPIVSRGHFIKGSVLAALISAVGGPARAAAGTETQSSTGQAGVVGHSDSAFVADQSNQPNTTRRVVTGRDAAGRSIFIMDGAAPDVFQRPSEDIVVTELWETRSAPADNNGHDDPSAHPLHVQPPTMGSVFRIISYPPAKPRESAPGEATKTHEPSFHTTNTVDYVIVLSGEIYALVDDGEVLLKAGDVLIQRGTKHAWRNRSDTPARVAFALIDALPTS
jgi:mannose-6-phosphate isomerase-like protein (cupin superfamily)